jgi:hypothetical protein
MDSFYNMSKLTLREFYLLRSGVKINGAISLPTE